MNNLKNMIMANGKIDFALIQEMENNVCFWDRFKLFIPGEEAVKYLIAHAEAFKLRGRYEVHSNEQYKLPLIGSIGEEYKLRVGGVSIKNLGEGVQLSGSFPKYYGTDESSYTWNEFFQTIEKLLSIIPADIDKVHIINLGVAVDFDIPSYIETSVRSIIMNILRFKGKMNKRTDEDYYDDGYMLQFLLSEYIFKIANTVLKGVTDRNNTIRFEMEIKKSTYLKDRGMIFLNDLLKVKNHSKLLHELAENVRHLIFYQNDVDNELLLQEEGIYCKSYNTRNAWDELHQKDPHKYKYVKNKLEGVIENKASYSYKKFFEDAFKNVLAQQEKRAVPVFPLYMEKREQGFGIPMITTTIPSLTSGWTSKTDVSYRNTDFDDVSIWKYFRTLYPKT